MINAFQSRPAVQDSAANSLRLLKAKVESETLTQVGQTQVQLLRQLSEGSYGTAHVAQVKKKNKKKIQEKIQLKNYRWWWLGMGGALQRLTPGSAW